MKRAFWFLFSADVFVILGEAIGLFCIEVLLYQQTGSKGLMGTVAFCFALPEFSLRLLGSAFIDRFDRIKLMSTINLVRGITLAILCTLAFLDFFSVWLFFIGAIILGACSAWFLPSGMALIPTLLEKEHLVRGYSLLESFSSLARLSGPFFASLFISWSGAEMGIGFFAGTVLIGSILIWLISTQPVYKERILLEIKSTELSWRQVRTDLSEGFSFFRRVPSLTVIMLLLAVSNFGYSLWMMLLVPFGVEVMKISITQISILNSVFSLGVISGSLFTSWLGEIRQRSKMMTGSFVATGLFTLIIPFAPNYAMLLVFFFLQGTTIPFFNANSSSIFGQLIPDSHRGRVMSFRLLLGQGAIPIGNMAGGWIAEAWGISSLFYIAGILTMVAGFIGLSLPWLKEVDGDLEPLATSIKRELIPNNQSQTPA